MSATAIFFLSIIAVFTVPFTWSFAARFLFAIFLAWEQALNRLNKSAFPGYFREVVSTLDRKEKSSYPSNFWPYFWYHIIFWPITIPIVFVIYGTYTGYLLAMVMFRNQKGG